MFVFKKHTSYLASLLRMMKQCRVMNFVFCARRDVIKLPAQFLARNWHQFISTLMTRCKRYYQLDFLRPQPLLFQYFIKLLEEYTTVPILPKDIPKRLGKCTQNEVLDGVKYRATRINEESTGENRERQN